MKTGKRSSVALWVVQAILAALFLFAGGVKLALPIAQLQGPIALPELFIRFVGIAEVAGGLGLVLPGLFRIWKEGTPLAAAGLAAIMAGAVVLTLEAGMVGPAAVPLTVGALAATVALGRQGWSRRLAPAR